MRESVDSLPEQPASTLADSQAESLVSVLLMRRHQHVQGMAALISGCTRGAPSSRSTSGCQSR